MSPEVIIAATLGPLVLLIVQAIKSFVPDLGQKAIPVTILISCLFAVLLVDWSLMWQTSFIQLATFTLEIAGVASGVYSWKPKKNDINLPDYVDES
jgi:ABC-type glucose/galactose transport system permease subunit